MTGNVNSAKLSGNRLLAMVLAMMLFVSSFTGVLSTTAYAEQIESPDTVDEVMTESYTITLDSGGNGRLQFTGKGKRQRLSLNDGESVLISILPDDGYKADVITAEYLNNGEKVVLTSVNNELEFVMPKSDVVISAAFVDESEHVASISENDDISTVQTYILQNADRELVGSGDKLVPYDVLNIKRTFAERDKFTDDDVSIDSIYADRNFDGAADNIDAFITQQSSYELLYEIDSESDYLVAVVDLLKSNAKAPVDVLFAWDDDNGNVINDCIYDYDTGLVYVPKSYRMTTENGELVLANVRTQLLYLEDNDESMTTPIDVTVDSNVKGNVASTGVADVDTLATSIELQLAEDDKAQRRVEKADMAVKVNDVCINDDLYNYNENTGTLSIDFMPSTVQSVEIVLEKQSVVDSVVDTIAGIFGIEASATTNQGVTISNVATFNSTNNPIIFKRDPVVGSIAEIETLFGKVSNLTQADTVQTGEYEFDPNYGVNFNNYTNIYTVDANGNYVRTGSQSNYTYSLIDYILTGSVKDSSHSNTVYDDAWFDSHKGLIKWHSEVYNSRNNFTIGIESQSITFEKNGSPDNDTVFPGIDRLYLECGHISISASNAGDRTFRLRVLDVREPESASGYGVVMLGFASLDTSGQSAVGSYAFVYKKAQEYGAVGIKKVDLSNRPLVGAAFEIYKEGQPNSPLALTYDTNTRIYGRANIPIEDIDNGDRYFLRETRAPIGFVKSQTEIPLIIKKDYKTPQAYYEAHSQNDVNIKNTPADVMLTIKKQVQGESSSSSKDKTCLDLTGNKLNIGDDSYSLKDAHYMLIGPLEDAELKNAANALVSRNNISVKLDVLQGDAVNGDIGVQSVTKHVTFDQYLDGVYSDDYTVKGGYQADIANNGTSYEYEFYNKFHGALRQYLYPNTSLKPIDYYHDLVTDKDGRASFSDISTQNNAGYLLLEVAASASFVRSHVIYEVEAEYNPSSDKGTIFYRTVDEDHGNDNNWHDYDIDVSADSHLDVYETPLFDPAGLRLEKQQATDHSVKVPNAVFHVTYYTLDPEAYMPWFHRPKDIVDNEATLHNVGFDTLSFDITTDANGQAKFDKAHISNLKSRYCVNNVVTNHLGDANPVEPGTVAYESMFGEHGSLKLPVGLCYVVETDAPTGYDLLNASYSGWDGFGNEIKYTVEDQQVTSVGDNEGFMFWVTENDLRASRVSVGNSLGPVNLTVDEVVDVFGRLTIKKYDVVDDSSANNTSYKTLEGAVYTVYNCTEDPTTHAHKSVYVNNTYKNEHSTSPTSGMVPYGEVAAVIITNASGVAKTPAKSLAPGNYYYVETKAPHGFKVNNTKQYFDIKQVTVGSSVVATNVEFAYTPKMAKNSSGSADQWRVGTTVYNLDDEESEKRFAATEPPVYGNVAVKKRLYEIDENIASNANRDLSNIEFTVYNASDYSIEVPTKFVASGRTVYGIDGHTLKAGDPIPRVVFNNQGKIVDYDESLQSMKTVAPNGVVTKIVTDADGYAVTPNMLPDGKYKISETKTNNTGVDVSFADTTFAVNVKDGKVSYSAYSSDATVGNDGTLLYNVGDHLLYANFKIKKVDSITGSTAQGDATLKDAKFEVYNISGKEVQLSNGTISSNDAAPCYTFKVDASGVYDSSKDFPKGLLPVGRYRIVEKTAPTGYKRNTDWKIEFPITGADLETAYNNKTVLMKDFTDSSHVCEEPPVYGGIRIVKIDRETKKSEAIEGTTLNGCKFGVYNRSAKPIQIGNKTYAVGSNEAITTITVNWDNTKQQYIGQTNSKLLPYGTYLVKEIAANDDYVTNGYSETVVVHPNNDGDMFDAPNFTTANGNEVYRADLKFRKRVTNGSPLKTAWLIERVDENDNSKILEAHVVVTDNSGNYSTENSFKSHTTNTNTHDSLLVDNNGNTLLENGKFKATNVASLFDSNGQLKDSVYKQLQIKNVNPCGVWFGKGEKGTATTVDNTLCALPVGTYRILELWSDTNAKARELVAVHTYTIDKPNDVLDLGDMIDHPVVTDLGTFTNRLPALTSELLSNVTGTHLAPSVNTTLTDTLSYEDLKPNTDYVATGWLVDARGVKINGTEVTKEFKTGDKENDKVSGTVTIEHKNFNGANYAESKVVAYANIKLKNAAADDYEVVHEDLTNEMQTVQFGSIETTARDNKTNSNVGAPVGGGHTIIDTVSYKNLIINDGTAGTFTTDKKYKLVGTLYWKHPNGTYEPVADLNNNKITKTISNITIDKTDGTFTQEMTFTLNNNLKYDLYNRSIVVYEVLYLGDKVVCRHESISDLAQTVSYPKVTTVAKCENTDSHQGVRETKCVIIDEIRCDNLVVGEDYHLVPELYCRSAGIISDDKDEYGKDVVKIEWIEGHATFKANQTSEKKRVKFTFDSTRYPDDTIFVCYVTLQTDDHVTLVEAKDPSDEDETIYYPSLETTATYSNTTKVTNWRKTQVKDTVDMRNLLPNTKYRLFSYLVADADNVDNDGMSYSRNVIDPILTDFTTPNSPVSSSISHSETIDFKEIDMTPYKGQRLVVCEQLEVFNPKTNDYKQVATHEDTLDKRQSVYVSDLRTKLMTAEGGYKELKAGEKYTLVDEIEYVNFAPGSTYVVETTLVDANKKDKNGDPEVIIEPFETYVEAAPKQNGEDVVSGKWVIPLPELDTTGYENRTFVAYEKIYATHKVPHPGDDTGTFTIIPGTTIFINGRDYVVDDLYVEHCDLTDDDQTVSIPEIRTTAIDTQTASHAGVQGETVVIDDTVACYNLRAGKKYDFEGVLMDKSTGKPLLDSNGKPYTAKNSYTVPNDKDHYTGTINMTFTFNSVELENKTVVVFENMYQNNRELAVHADINDKDQSVHYAKVRTTASVIHTGHEALAKNNLTLNDAVKYENVVENLTYRINGVLMDKESKKALVDKDGKEITAQLEFVANAASGTKDLVFTFDARDFKGQTIVVFERLSVINPNTKEAVEIAKHTDFDDLEQTITIPEIHTHFADKATGLQEIAANREYDLVDTIDYANLSTDSTYTIKSVVVDKETKETLDEATNTFKPDKATGSTTVTIPFNTKDLDGHTLVCFEYVSVNADGVSFEDGLVAIHEDINDLAQTITIPYVHTTAKSAITLDQQGSTVKDMTIIDTVEYGNVIRGHYYTLIGKLMDKTTNKPVMNDGKEIVSTKTFKAQDTVETLDMPFKFDATGLKGHDVVVFEYLETNDVPLGEHADINDKGQTIYFPEIGTTATTTTEHLTLAKKDIEVVDNVKYKNLIIGKAYTVRGTLMDKATGKPILDDNGNEITASAKFVAEATSGSVDVIFKFSGVTLAGKTVVAFEELYSDEKLLTTHADIEDEDQTVKIPKIGTRFTDKLTHVHEVPANKDCVLVDTIDYANLDVDKEYTIKSAIVDKDTKETLDEATKTFKPETENGSVDVEFNFNTKGLDGHTIVCFEYIGVNIEGMSFEDSIIAVHEDIDDLAQTITIPYVHTTAKSGITLGKQGSTVKNMTIIDTVEYGNVVKGHTYTLTGVLMDKNTNKPVLNGGKEIVVSKTFEAKDVVDTIDIAFEFDATELKDHDVVVFEDLSVKNGDDDVPLTQHNDINDEGQTIYFPEIGTTASTTTGHEVLATEEITIVDEVRYRNLIIGKKYNVTGVLMDKGTGKELLDDEGNTITSTVEFVPTEKNGTVDVTFTFKGVNVADKTIVAFETLKEQEFFLTSHADIEDEDQTVTVPHISTLLTEKETGLQEIGSSRDYTLVDTITYRNMTTKNTYIITGLVVDKETKKTVASEVKEFTPDKINGTVDMAYHVNTTGLDGHTLVCFEYISIKVADAPASETRVAVHEDLNDVKQTITIPSVHTTAKSGITLDKQGSTIENMKIVDTVEYTNIIPGHKYILSGALMDKTTGKAVVNDGKDVVSSVTFTAKDANGQTDVEFNFDATELKNHDVVVFESLYVATETDDVPLTDHTDIEDEGQTIYFPEIGTTATVDNTVHESLAKEDITLTDRVEYKNLRVGTEYTVNGTLMDKETGKPMLDDGGKEIKSSTTFVAETANGFVDVVFKFDAVTLAGKTVVAFEDLNIGKNTVTVHADIEDKEQTVKIPKIGTRLSDKKTKIQEIAADSEYVLVDVIDFENMSEGNSYVIHGKLVDKETQKTLVEVEQDFTPETADGSVDVEFKLNTKGLDGHTVVAFEYISAKREGVSFEDGLVAVHEDINDKSQTVTIPEVHTSARSAETGDKEGITKDKYELIDTVYYDNLIPGKTYTISGQVCVKATGKFIEADGRKYTVSKTFTPEKPDGSVELKFVFDASELKGTDAVVFETLKQGDIILNIHADINDREQTVNFPEIDTVATYDGKHEAIATSDVAVKDEIKFTNFTVGKEYTIDGILMDKDTGKPMLDPKGNEIKTQLVMTADQPDGVVEVEFNFDASEMGGKTVVVFETVTSNDVERTVHADLTDEDQSVHFVEIHTTLTKDGTDSHSACASENVVLCDTVFYTNLVVGKLYTVHGTLMDKATGEAMLDDDGKPIVASAAFRPEQSNGSVDVLFKFKGVNVAGKTTVAFETLERDNRELAVHADINDRNQTVTFPKIGTTAFDNKTRSHMLSEQKEITVIDTVAYDNLVSGDTYAVIGTLMDKATGKAASKTMRVDFIPKASKGTVDVEFTIEDKDIDGKTFVAFEELRYVKAADDSIKEGYEVLVASHKDLNDVNQTVYALDVHTTATGEDGTSKSIEASENTVIVDRVEYKNLIPNVDYSITGKLVKADGSVVKTETVNFKPKETDGSVDVTFVVDTKSGLEQNETEVKYVCFEYVYDENKVLIGQHEDLNDEDQTVIVKDRITYQTGDLANVGLVVSVIALLLALAGVTYLAYKRRKDEI